MTDVLISEASDDGFDRFMAERWPRVVRSAFLLTGDRHDAEDASGDRTGVVVVRSGDLVASTVVAVVPSGQGGIVWMEELAKQTAIRLTSG